MRGVLLVCITAVLLAATTPAPASAATPLQQGDGIGPGSHLFMTFDSDPANTYSCTANFVWSATNGKTYLGAAGHCFLPANKIATHGPFADYDPSHTHVKVCISSCQFGGQAGFIITGSIVPLGPVAYARQTDGKKNDLGNDFGLVEIPTSQTSRVRHAMPVWGAMSGIGPIGSGTQLCHYGWAGGFGETFPTAGRTGVGLGSDSDGVWHAALASFEGDSGSAIASCVADAQGNLHAGYAAGILTHLVAKPLAQAPVAGTTVAKAEKLALEAGLTVVPALGA